MKKIFILTLALFAGVQTVDACSYPYQTPQEKLAGADLVFLGKVVSASTTVAVSDPANPVALGSLSTTKNVFTVARVWKGSVTPTMTVYSSHTVGTSCGSFAGTLNHEYIVFAKYSAETGTYTVTEVGAEDMAYIEARPTLAVLGNGTNIIASTTATTTPVTPVVVPPTPQNIMGTFNTNLKLGMRHIDVKRLQTFLNRSGFTVATSGEGSFGQEGMYFGSKTMAALIRYQNAHKAELGITRGTGFFGAATRSLLNK